MSTYKLEQNITQTLAVTGRYFRVLTSVGELTVRIFSQGSEIYNGKLKSGLGISFDDKAQFPAPFDQIQVTSTESQTVELWHELAKVDDDRLSGNFDINAALNVASTAPRVHNVSSQTITGPTEVLAINANRISALIQTDGAVNVQTVDGVELNGLFTWQNQAALTLVPVSGSVVVRINEDTN